MRPNFVAFYSVPCFVLVWRWLFPEPQGSQATEACRRREIVVYLVIAMVTSVVVGDATAPDEPVDYLTLRSFLRSMGVFLVAIGTGLLTISAWRMVSAMKRRRRGGHGPDEGGYGGQHCC